MKIKAIIPCAGYGTRMNMSPNESKEMLIDPVTNKFIIDYSLDLCKQYDLEPIVVTRSSKEDLNGYLKRKKIHTIVNDEPGEWMDSVLASKNEWSEYTIVLLPDTRFEPTHIIQDIKDSLTLGVDSVFAVHKVDDTSKWGSIEDYHITEKSKKKTKGFAWGIMGFYQGVGVNLLNSMKDKGKSYPLTNASFLFFNKFTDITRTGKLEAYV